MSIKNFSEVGALISRAVPFSTAVGSGSPPRGFCTDESFAEYTVVHIEVHVFQNKYIIGDAAEYRAYRREFTMTRKE